MRFIWWSFFLSILNHYQNYCPFGIAEKIEVYYWRCPFSKHSFIKVLFHFLFVLFVRSKHTKKTIRPLIWKRIKRRKNWTFRKWFHTFWIEKTFFCLVCVCVCVVFLILSEIEWFLYLSKLSTLLGPRPSIIFSLFLIALIFIDWKKSNVAWSIIEERQNKRERLRLIRVEKIWEKERGVGNEKKIVPTSIPNDKKNSHFYVVTNENTFEAFFIFFAKLQSLMAMLLLACK